MPVGKLLAFKFFSHPHRQIFGELDENIPQAIETFHNNQLQLIPPWVELVQLKVLQSKSVWELIGGDEAKHPALLLNRNRCLVFLTMEQVQSEAGSCLEGYEYMGNCLTPAENERID